MDDLLACIEILPDDSKIDDTAIAAVAYF